MAESRPSVSAKQLVIVASILLLLICGYFGVRRWWAPPTQPGVDEGREVAEKFLATVRSGKAGEAWDATTSEFKSIEGRESFIRKAKAAPILKEPLQFNSIQQVTIDNVPRSEYLFQSPNAKVVRVLVGYERGNWKVDRLTL